MRGCTVFVVVVVKAESFVFKFFIYLKTLRQAAESGIDFFAVLRDVRSCRSAAFSLYNLLFRARTSAKGPQSCFQQHHAEWTGTECTSSSLLKDKEVESAAPKVPITVKEAHKIKIL